MRTSAFQIRFTPEQWADEVTRARLVKQARERLAMQTVEAGYTIAGKIEEAHTFVGRTPDGRYGPTPHLDEAEFVIVNLIQPVR